MGLGEYRRSVLKSLRESQSGIIKKNYYTEKNGARKEFYSRMIRRQDSLENLELLERYMQNKHTKVESVKSDLLKDDKGQLRKRKSQQFRKSRLKRSYTSGIASDKSRKIIKQLFNKGLGKGLGKTIPANRKILRIKTQINNFDMKPSLFGKENINRIQVSSVKGLTSIRKPVTNTPKFQKLQIMSCRNENSSRRFGFKKKFFASASRDKLKKVKLKYLRNVVNSKYLED